MIDFPRSVRMWIGVTRILAPSLLILVLFGRVAAATVPTTEIKLLDTTPGGQIYELAVGSYEIESLTHAGVDYQRLLIPGADLVAEPGAPETPVFGTLIGLPSSSKPSIHVISAEYDTLDGLRLAPAPSVTLPAYAFAIENIASLEEVIVPESDSYANDAFLPGPLVEIGEPGHVRDQAVTGLRFYPVQFNPASGQVRIYSRIVVEVSVGDSIGAAGTIGRRPDHPIVEELLSRILLNHDSLAHSHADNSVPQSADIASPARSMTGRQRLKLYVEEDGIYTVSYSDLQAAGFDPDAVDPRRLRLSSGGTEIPILVVGEDDGRFDEDDRILWYGVKLDDLYTLANVYWLEEDDINGARMAERNVAPVDAVAATSFPWSVHVEENYAYWQTMPNGEGEDHYFWGGLISPNTVGLTTYSTFTVTLNHIDRTAADASVRVRLKGYTAGSHHTQIKLNDSVIDDQKWEGQIVFDHDVDVAHEMLVEGDNVLIVQTLDAGASVDQLLVDWLEIDYIESYVAENDRLRFGAPEAGTFRFEPTGFDSDEILLFDITSPSNPIYLTGGRTLADGTQFRLQFDDGAMTDSRYFAVTRAAYLSPAGSVLDTPSTWRSPAIGADYLIITHALFDEAAEKLATHRLGQGLRVAKVDVQDLYDEFNDGIFNPSAIRDFLVYAYEHWQPPAPAYAVLMGDSSIDFKDNRRSGTTSFVPTQLIDTPLLGQTATDHWFTTVSGDDALPDIFLGRLSVESPAEATDVVAKLISYDVTPPDDTWSHHLVMIADDGTPVFRGLSEALINRSPHYYAAERIYVESYPPGDPAADIRNAFEDGAVLMNYAGHGSTQNWGVWQGNDFFGVSDIPELVSSNRLPFVTVANCLSGFFAGSSSFASIAEGLQRAPEKGAIAVFAPTDLGYASGHRTLMEELHDALFQDDLTNIGAATAAAQMAAIGRSSTWTDMVETYVLFGDPYTKLGIPINYPYVKRTSPADQEIGVAVDRPVQIQFNKPVDANTVSLGGVPNAALTWNEKFTVATYNHNGLDHGQTYELVVSAMDRLGNALGDGEVPNRWTFVVDHDDRPPATDIDRMGDGGDGVGGNTIALTFDESVRPSSLSYTIDPVVPGEIYWQSGNSAATFVPENGFQLGQRYTFTVSAVTDLAGNRMVEPVIKLLYFGESSSQLFLPAVVAN